MADITLFPRPASLTRLDAPYTLRPQTRIVCDNAALGETLAGYLRPATGFALPVETAHANSASEHAIILAGSDAIDSPEGYSLRASGTTLHLSASDRRGHLHGMQTIRQLLPREILGGEVAASVNWTMPGLAIEDEPAFEWRGMHLDVGRHVFPVAFIKKIIRALAFYKYNTFHWHLTEDQGWRIDIKKYPRLTEIGGFRAETVIGNNSPDYDGKPYGGFYTQDDIREVVAYAAAHGISVVPEIELPGHAVAALAAYPQLGCRGEGYQVRKNWGIAKDIFCAGKDEVFAFLEDVLGEVLELFPSEYIHIGGDEAPKDRWENCPACQARIQSRGAGRMNTNCKAGSSAASKAG